MKSINWSKEIFKLILYIGIVILLLILGKVVFDSTHYSSALIGVSGGFLGISIFQLVRIINFKRNPEKYHKEQIDYKDERNNMIISSAKSSAYDAEIFGIIGLSIYAIYLNNVEMVIGILILWVIRIFSFFYYLNKNNKHY